MQYSINVMYLRRWSHYVAVSLLCFAFCWFVGITSATSDEIDNAFSESGRYISADADRVTLNAFVSFFRESRRDTLKESRPQSTPGSTLMDVMSTRVWTSHSQDRVLNFGFTPDTIWVKVPLVFEPGSGLARYLVIPYPMLEDVELALIDSQGQLVFNSNVFHSRKNQKIPSQFIRFALPSSLAGEYVVVLRVRSTTSMQIPLEIWSESYLVARQLKEALWWGLYFGVLLALTAYNGFLYFSVRDLVYCYYGLYLITTAGVMLCLSGMGSLYLWPYDAAINQHALTFFTGITSLFLLVFVRSFLDRETVPDTLKGLLSISAVMCGALVAFAWFRPFLGAQLSGWMASIAIGVAIFAGIYALSIGVVIARYFVLAFAMFALGASLYLLTIFGWLPVSTLTNHAVQLGSALEAILLSLALAHRIKEDRMAVIRALKQKHESDQQLKQLELDALEAALHDPLTRMPNDALLMSRMSEVHLTGAPPLFALVLLQFPQMRGITASLGRAVAEPLFVRIVKDINRLLAQRERILCLEEKSRAFVAVTEFGTLAFLCRREERGVDYVKAMAESIRSTYDNPLDVAHLTLNMPAICAITLYPGHGEKPDLLLQHANVSIEQAIRSGERLCVYSQDIEAFGHRRLALMGALSRAIHEGELDIYVQPQLDCFGMKLVGAEILLRWNSARHGMVPTREFIDIAEQAGLMPQLGRYVITRALHLLKELHEQKVPVTLSVNLSVKNLMEDKFVGFVVDTAEAMAVDMRHIVLEVTESCASENIDIVIDSLKRLSSTGCSIALDDFGTGYSSLAYLSRLPIHELKIDRSFISQMRNSDSDMRIVENTVKLARTLQLQTVAEGVEDADMLSIVRLLGCDRVQGYFTGRPMPADMFSAWALRKAG